MRNFPAALLALGTLSFPLAAGPLANATVTLTSSANPVVYGAPVTLTITVTGSLGNPTPTGTVTLLDASASSSPVATLELDITGAAQVVFPMPVITPGYASPVPYYLSAGTHNLTAVYTGDFVYDYSYTPIFAQQVTQAGSALTVITTQTSPATIVLTALVAATGTPLPCPSLTGVPHQDGSPTGTVEFFNGGLSLGSLPLVQGTMTGCVSVAGTTVSQINGTLTATYSGDNNFTASTFSNALGPFAPMLASSVSLDATPSNPSIVQPVTLTATIGIGAGAAPPTGVVQFFLDGGKLLGTATVTNGTASVTASLPGGSHNITGNYSGDANYLPSTNAIGLYISSLTDTLTLTAGAPTAVYGQSVTFTATVKAQASTGVPSPTGTVQFSSGCACGLFGGFVAQTVLGSAALSQGVATLTVTGLAAGTVQVVAAYSGDTNWVSSTSTPASVTLSKAATTTTWTSLGTDPKSGNLVVTAVVQSASGSGAPTGTVQVLDAATNALLASTGVSAGGVATAAFSAKTSSIVAAYSGDANFAASTSAAASLLTIADAAGYGTASVAPDEIVSLFGSGLAAPVEITDSAGTARTPALLLTSPAQINLVIPDGTAPGTATVTVSPPSGPSFAKPISITEVAPGLFAANGGGTGPAAAQIIRVAADGSQSVEGVVTLDSTGKLYVGAPISFAGDSLYLVLYGTGIRNRSANANVTCTIGGQVLPVLYSGAQGPFAGLDQVNVALPASLAGAGTVNVVVTADGHASNAVTLTFQ
jgi:uncharacterized protein (TIGR03437 family)